MKLLGKWLPLLQFRDSGEYWRRRYRLGGDSGEGSGGAVAAYKAQVLNAFVKRQGVEDVIEFGCGDGRQLARAEYPKYFGLDISPEALSLCRSRFAYDKSKQFALLKEYVGETADLALSLDVLFHLVEDEIYFEYLDRLFAAGRRYVAIFATSSSDSARTLRHVRHRPVESDISARFPSFKRMTGFEAGLRPRQVGQRGAEEARFFFLQRSD